MSDTINFPNSEDAYIRKAVDAYKDLDYPLAIVYFNQGRDAFSTAKDFVKRTVELFLESNLIEEALNIAELGDLMNEMSASQDFAESDFLYGRNSSQSLDFTEVVLNYYDNVGIDWPDLVKEWLSVDFPVRVIKQEVVSAIFPDLFAQFTVEADETVDKGHFYQLLQKALQGEKLAIYDEAYFIQALHQEDDLLLDQQWADLLARTPSLVFVTDLLETYLDLELAEQEFKTITIHHELKGFNTANLTHLVDSDFFQAGNDFIAAKYYQNPQVMAYLETQWKLFVALIYPFFSDLALTAEELISLIYSDFIQADEHLQLSPEKFADWEQLNQAVTTLLGQYKEGLADD
ncbi:hypothetical protein [Aerococcus kribbianus]|uniref:Uncharacterized protein n=1 Tax=Aerococcus kribbianus TaxID=2999064 RepID=A0A9X3FNP7_9LACT|nr:MULTISPECIES: hypothetical protein [unclassified Aerococcus]MCZ0716941.1 hypothetical protein [Aerococcus sp. YH-aer221]MCZ0725229.1 hypothetical protein [Aerococcus sp. YH-aer222]